MLMYFPRDLMFRRFGVVIWDQLFQTNNFAKTNNVTELYFNEYYYYYYYLCFFQCQAHLIKCVWTSIQSCFLVTPICDIKVEIFLFGWLPARCQFHQHCYVQIFCTNVVSAAFSSYVLALAKNSYKKCSRKMLMKLTKRRTFFVSFANYYSFQCKTLLFSLSKDHFREPKKYFTLSFLFPAKKICSREFIIWKEWTPNFLTKCFFVRSWIQAY